MKIAILSYDTPHKKTHDVFMNLTSLGVENIDIILMPFTNRPERPVCFHHRPFQFEGPDPRSLVSLTKSGQVFFYEDWQSIVDQYDHILVCGSNLIDREFANCGKIINCHSGLIPISRGLDSFKWSIINELPIGNTLHIINEEADSGTIIAHLKTPLFQEDDLNTFAERHYKYEIFMLSNFLHFITLGNVINFDNLPNEPTKRMPKSIEIDMVRAFDDFYKKNYAVGCNKKS